jgi:transcriptional regulator with XRE-family HTH domain
LIKIKTEILDDTNLERFTDTLRFLMKQSDHMNETQLAKAVNIPQPTIHRLLSGKVTDPRISTLNTLAMYFNISLDQLLGNIPINKENKKTSRYINPLPIISWDNTVNAKSLIESLTPQNWQEWASIDIETSSISYALVSKPFMSPRFPIGSILIIDSEIRASDGDLVIVYFKKANDVSIREIILDGCSRKLRSILSDADTEPLTDEHEILGVVIQTRFSYR